MDRYSHILNCVEINSTFYRSHMNRTWKRWYASVPDHFRFSVKMPKAITHEAKLNCSAADLSIFLEQVSLLSEKLGPILIQLPPSLQFLPSNVESFLSLLRGQYSGDIVWEPRHFSWFDGEADELLKEFRVGRVAADPACVLPGTEIGGYRNTAYFRMHGSPRRYYSSYSDQILDLLAAQLVTLASGASVWCVFDNTASGSATRNAIELTGKLRHLYGCDASS